MPSQAEPSDPPPLTLCCCVEYGALEDGVIRLARSLRTHGGRFAGARLIAVTPRRGPALRDSTLQRFRELDVEHVRCVADNGYEWHSYFNKVIALREVEARATTDQIAFVDSDILILGEPEELLLSEGEDVAACPRDRNIGVAGPDDEHGDYWVDSCRLAGLSLEDLPLVRTAVGDDSIRLYWNSGLFVYRRGRGFIEHWRETQLTMLRNASRWSRYIFWSDQVALGLTAVAGGYTVRHLPGSYNYGMASHFKDHLNAEDLGAARILHYHDSMQPEQWDWTLSWLDKARPDVTAWLGEMGPVMPPSDRARNLSKQAWRGARSLRRRGWKLRQQLHGLTAGGDTR